MKRKVISIISIALSVVMIFSLSSCKKDDKVPAAVKPTDVSLGKPVADDGYFNYSVVRSDKASDETEALAKELRNTLRLNFEAKVTFAKDTRDYDKNEYEILVGDTNRPESTAAKKLLEENRANNVRDFLVKVDGFKIVIVAITEDGLKNAVAFFENSFCKDEDTWYYLYNEYSFLYAPVYDEATHTIAGEPLVSYKIITTAQNSRIVVDQIEQFTDNLNENSGILMNVEDDSAADTQYEIVIGNTGRAQSAGKPKAGYYTIAVKDKKLVLTAGNDEALAGAVKKLNAMYSEAIANKTALVFDENYSITEKYEAGEDGYKYVWGDEFNASLLNRSLWVSQSAPYETVSCLGTRCMGRKAEGCYVRNGNAVIYATHDPKTDDFTHRQICTKGTHYFLYGCMEFRAKLAEAPAANALWYGTESPDGTKYGATQEIDLLEDFGKPGFAANIHRWWNSSIGSGHTSLDGGDFSKAKRYELPEGGAPLSDDYHIFSFQWDPEVMNFCVDGKVFFSYDIGDDVDGKGVDVFNTPMCTLMSTTLGAATYGVKWTREDKDYYELLVDYVRLYQRDCDNGYSIQRLK